MVLFLTLCFYHGALDKAGFLFDRWGNWGPKDWVNHASPRNVWEAELGSRVEWEAVCPVLHCIAGLLPVILFSKTSPLLLPPSQPGPPSISVGTCGCTHTHTHTHTQSKGLEGCSVQSPFQRKLLVPFLATHGPWLLVTYYDSLY